MAASGAWHILEALAEDAVTRDYRTSAELSVC